MIFWKKHPSRSLSLLKCNIFVRWWNLLEDFWGKHHILRRSIKKRRRDRNEGGTTCVTGTSKKEQKCLYPVPLWWHWYSIDSHWIKNIDFQSIGWFWKWWQTNKNMTSFKKAEWESMQSFDRLSCFFLKWLFVSFFPKGKNVMLEIFTWEGNFSIQSYQTWKFLGSIR